jgi:two-component system, chemotaxis family, CheB/CheR fusion protein
VAPAFPIVGVGASAGGLEAFTQLLKHLPVDTGMGFVLVQHLDPEHASALTQLLKRTAAMPVNEVTNNQRVEPNHIHVIPPNTNLSIAHGVLKLHPRQAGRASQHSIDFFFESLAHDRHELAVGIILSGTASDGTLGLEAIKAEGGITLAQDESAKYDSMPRSAIAAGVVDYVLAPENMASELARIAKHPYVAGQAREDLAAARSRSDVEGEEAKESPEQPDGEQNGFKKILLLLRNQSGVDFSRYKSTTIQRRIARRILLSKVGTAEAYANFLRGKPKELEALYSDLLINVTSFFRNPAAFEVLQAKVFPQLIAQSRDKPLRVWVPGCSTGQEAYSIAMAFVETAEAAGDARKLQVFATDLNEMVLEKARTGFYAQSFVHDLSPERLHRFFVEADGGYRVAKFLRETLVFARQNLFSDPPFSRMDLISCRNVLIYLEPDLQRKVLPTLHYALNPGGFLFLGESESLGPLVDVFERVDKKHKIFSKKPGVAAHPSIVPRHPAEKTAIPTPKPPALPAKLNPQREADRVTLHRFAPPGVLINAQLQVLQFRGETSPFLKPPTGSANLDLLKMAREGLMLPLRAALDEAKKDNKTIRKEGVHVDRKGGTRAVNFEIVPLTHLNERCWLVFFEEPGRETPPKASKPFRQAQGPEPAEGETKERQAPPQKASTASRPPSPVETPSAKPRIADLERELSETRDYLQSVHEQYESTNEELQASNEEVTSANEELQSINEELETSKEELESTNEELTTVNDEMAHRNADLNRLNSDLNNLHASLNTAIVVVSRDLTVRSFTPPAEKSFKLLAADVGRPLSRLRHNLDLPDLEPFIHEVIDTASVHEREVRDQDDHWYALRVRPYLTLDKKIDGAVIMLVDIDALKRSEQEIAGARAYAEDILRTSQSPLLVLTAGLRVHDANAAFYESFRVSPAETKGRLIYEMGNGQWNIPKLREFLEEILPRNSSFDDFEVTHDFETIGHRTLLLNARRLQNEAERPPERILLGIDDITDRKRTALMAEQARLLDLSNDAIIVCDWSNRIGYWNKGAEALYGYPRDEAIGKVFHELSPAEFPEPRDQIFAKLERDGHWSGEIVKTRRDGQRVTVATRWTLARDAQGRPSSILRAENDITERKRIEEALRESEGRLRAVVETAVDGIITIDEHQIISSVNPAAESVFGYAAAEMIGRNVSMLMPEPYHAAHDSSVANTLRTGERKIIDSGREAEGRRKDGTTFPLDLAVAEVRLEGRRVFIGFVRDITERKLAKEKLERTVAERTAKLRETVGELEAFSYSIVHDLRAPLRAMEAFASILAKECGDQINANGKDYLRRIVTSAERMDYLIQDVLNYSRIVRGDLPLASLNVGRLLRGILESYQHLQPPHAEISLEGTFPRVWANEAGLTQCISNLLGNAVKFVVPGVTPRVRVWAETRENNVRLIFKDNGIGIAQEMHGKIFEIFERLSKKYEGTGIGLAIVKKAAERMGGSVGVESEPGKGSTFWLELAPATAETA